MAYAMLAYSYWASFYNVYGCLRHTHYRCRLQLPYKTHRTCLTNHMRSISHHIMPLVNSLRGRYTCTHARTHTHTHTHTHKHTQTHTHTHTLEMRWDDTVIYQYIVIHTVSIYVSIQQNEYACIIVVCVHV